MIEPEIKTKTDNSIFKLAKLLVTKVAPAIIPNYIKQLVGHVCKSLDLVKKILFSAPNLKNEDFKVLDLPTHDGYSAQKTPSIAKQQEIKLEEIKQENHKKVEQAIGKISTSNLPQNLKQTFINALAVKDALGYPASLLGDRLLKMNSIDSDRILKDFGHYL
jgi:hypothetical protein